MDDLVKFLRARLDVEEQVAREATMGPWQNAPTASHHATATGRTEEAVFAAPPDKGATIVATTGVPSQRQNLVNAEHIARHDPARVLRDVEAKRRIVDAYLPPGADPHPGLPCINYEGQDPADYDDYDSCSRHLEATKHRFHTDYVLRLLALSYADHPSYREEWRP